MGGTFLTYPIVFGSILNHNFVGAIFLIPWRCSKVFFGYAKVTSTQMESFLRGNGKGMVDYVFCLVPPH